MEEQIILRIKDLSLMLQNKIILKDIDVSIPQGLTTVIIGPSGAGKSSLIKCIPRLYQYEGKIIFKSNSTLDIDIAELRKNINYVSQLPVVFPGSVRDNIFWGRSYWNLETSDNIAHDLLKSVNLADISLDQNANQLSVGQKQRLHLARALAVEPEVILLDEPASSLDAISKQSFENLITKLKQENPELSVIMITHDLNQAKRMAEYAILLNEGRKLLEEPAEVFFDRVKDMDVEADMLKSLLSNKNGGN